MSGLSEDTLRGYILEELLARLIRTTGYRLLVDESQDPVQLKSGANGLSVRGRGGIHQVDVLGELAWIPAFTFPLRLFVEAKARSGRTGIGDVRNAVGVVSDVNQSLLPAPHVSGPLTQRFSYRYALFSTSGFTRPAAEYALAHQISLVDLSTRDFQDLRSLAGDIAERIWANGPQSRSNGYIRRIRARLRSSLDTWPTEVQFPESGHEADELDLYWEEITSDLRERVTAIGELFVGMANGPYLLLLRAQDPRHLTQILEINPSRDVSIRWSPDLEEGTRWVISINAGPEETATLSFSLPDEVASWVFDPEADPRRRALQFKEAMLSTITIYRFVNAQDRIYRLRYRPEEAAESWTRRP